MMQICAVQFYILGQTASGNVIIIITSPVYQYLVGFMQIRPLSFNTVV